MKPTTILILGIAPFVSGPMTQISAEASIFLDTLGWEEDVDLVVAPGGEFLVVPEEAPDGSGKITIVDLDAATGEPLGIGYFEEDLPGFEVGVDPIIIPELVAGDGYTVLVPLESPDGTDSGVLVLLLDDDGVLLDRVPIDLDDLGFREDVDGTWTHYLGPAIAFFALEGEDEVDPVRGVLAIDVDTNDITDPAGVGACNLLSTDGRLNGTVNVLVDWLPGLAPGQDPVAYEVVDAARLALPVTSALGSDLLLIDFDPNDPVAPVFSAHFSSKAQNVTSTLPTDFPGFEQDVDIRLFDTECGLAGRKLLVPVEGPGDVGDVYLLDEDGHSIWVLSNQVATLGLNVPGFEKGVDLMPLCSLGDGSNRLAVPLETADGTDADLWFVDLVTGSLLARAEDPTLNPGLTIEGWEIGVDLVRWTDSDVLAPVEDTGGSGRLLCFAPDGTLQDTLDLSVIDGNPWGFVRSVDLVVADVPDPPFATLFAPVERVGVFDAEILMFPVPPTLVAGFRLEVINVGFECGPLETDVDLGTPRKTDPGGAWLYLPEENASGSRLRFEPLPNAGDPVLAVATDENGAILPALHLFRAQDGTLITSHNDVRGLVAGLDLANGRGSVTPGNLPDAYVPAGFDADTDPASITAISPTDAPILWESTTDSASRIHHRNPLSPPVEIRYAVPRSENVSVEIVDATGRRIRHLHGGFLPEGSTTFHWDGLNDDRRRVASGVYFLLLRGDRGIQVSKMVVLR